jgi:hypothetical protein
LNNRLSQLLREEELRWYQRFKAKHLLEGDSNTKYFQLLANGRHRKSRIFQVQNGSQIISGDDDLKKYIISYYQGLFGPPQESSFRLDAGHREYIPQVSDEKNRLLVEAFSEEEVRHALFQMEQNKAPGPDGFPAKFYQVFWEVIKGDLMALFHEFHCNTPCYDSPNHHLITFIRCLIMYQVPW